MHSTNDTARDHASFLCLSLRFIGLAEHMIAANSRRRYQGRFSCNSITCRLAVEGTRTNPSVDIRFLPDVPPLEDDGNNFVLWKLRVEMVLSLQGLWGVIDGPGRTKRWTRPPIRKGLPNGKKSRDLKVRAQIILTLKDEPLKPPPAFYTEIYTYSAAPITRRQMESTHLSDSMKSRNFTTYYNSDLSTQKR